MNVFLRSFLIMCCLFAVNGSVSAFYDDFEINNINLGQENFLDIKAHRYRKSLEYRWLDKLSGWRSNIASLDTELAFIQTELKAHKTLSEYVDIRFQVMQEVFFANKDFPLPTAEIIAYPWAGNLGFSFLGTPTYEKREMDLGLAVIWGRRPWNYTRFEYLDVDRLYNVKNVTDNTFYSKEPVALTLEGAYLFGAYKLRFSMRHDKPLALIDPDVSGVFNHEASDYNLLFDYLPTPHTVIGISLKGLTLDKSSLKTGLNQSQATDYISADVYLVSGLGQAYEYRVGAQYDHIRNDIRDVINNDNDLDYFMKTSQLYATAYHRFNEHMAWDIGLYVGHVKEQQNYLLVSAPDIINDSTESKLRYGFEYFSSDRRSSLQLNMSLNLDDPVRDPGDGGAISFQSVF